ncbi:hypothetical protein KY285_033891 [Solanum tuberosum]|nr:hypothetical protein KY285_033891 [Solanum tuberosum]
MEYLSRGLNTLTEFLSFAHHPRCAKLEITHLIFADDLLLFAKGDLPSVTAIQQVYLYQPKRCCETSILRCKDVAGTNSLIWYTGLLVATVSNSNEERVPWKVMMYNNEARPKVIFSLWLYLQDRTHLFVQCSLASSLWTRICSWLKRTTLTTSDWENHLAGVKRDAKGKALKAQLFKMVYTETIHAIWTKRNQRQFEKKTRAMEMIAKDIAFTCNARAQPMISNLLQQYKF